MKKFDAEKNIFWQTDKVFNLADLDNCSKKIIVWYCTVCEINCSKNVNWIFQQFADTYFSKSVCISNCKLGIK